MTTTDLPDRLCTVITEHLDCADRFSWAADLREDLTTGLWSLRGLVAALERAFPGMSKIDMPTALSWRTPGDMLKTVEERTAMTTNNTPTTSEEVEAVASRLDEILDDDEQDEAGPHHFVMIERADAVAILRALKSPTSIIAESAKNEPGREGEDFQLGVDRWMDQCFGEPIKSDQLERTDRFTEEALELAQTVPGFTKDRAHALVDYVFDRPQGEINQEVGGVMVTLAALCNTTGVRIDEAAATELARIWTKVDMIRAKQAAKPTGSALPVAEPSSAAPDETIGDVGGEARDGQA